MIAAALAQASQCPPDSVQVGDSCVDKYEASVWQISLAETELIAALKAGTATLADLQAGGAVQLGTTGAPFNHTAYPINFPEDGNWSAVFGSTPPSPGVYAASVANVLPTTQTTQLQAAQACALAGKRLIRNDEWQLAAAATPDPGIT